MRAELACYRTVASAFSLLAIGLFLEACCTHDGPGYSLGIGSSPVGSSIEWNGATPVTSGRLAIVTLWEVQVEAVPEPPMIELYSGDEQIEIDGALLSDVALSSEDCNGPVDEVVYDFSSLPPGEYRMVHRLSTAPAGLDLRYVESAEQTLLDGEPAVVTTLVVPIWP
jgi:hypothetical protein